MACLGDTSCGVQEAGVKTPSSLGRQVGSLHCHRHRCLTIGGYVLFFYHSICFFFISPRPLRAQSTPTPPLLSSPLLSSSPLWLEHMAQGTGAPSRSLFVLALLSFMTRFGFRKGREKKPDDLISLGMLMSHKARLHPVPLAVHTQWGKHYVHTNRPTHPFVSSNRAVSLIKEKNNRGRPPPHVLQEAFEVP